MEFLGDILRNLRECKEKKQKEVAEELLIAENTWSQYETNKRVPDVDMLKKIANYFEISTDYLLLVTDERYNPCEEEFKELTYIYQRLNKEERKRLINLAKKNFMIERR